MDRAKLRVGNNASRTTFCGFSFELFNKQCAKTLSFLIRSYGNVAQKYMKAVEDSKRDTDDPASSPRA